MGERGPKSPYQESFCDDIIAWGKLGEFPVKWCSRLGVSKQTLHKWRGVHPEFKMAYGVAKTHAESKLVNRTMEGDALDLAKGKWYLSACFGVSETNKQMIQAEIAEAPELKMDFGDRDEE